MEEFGITKKTDQILFTLPQDVSKIFSKDAGEITSYQVLVIGKSSNEGIREKGKVSSRVQTWAQAKKEDFKSPYATDEQTDSPAEWRTSSSRRKRVVERTITVGEDKCKDSEVSSYCNGPLKPNRDYCVYLRGWTEGGYSDSHCVAEAKTDQNLVPIIIGVVVALCIFGILGGGIYCLRKHCWGQFKRRMNTPKDTEMVMSSDLVERHSLPATQDIQENEELRLSEEFQRICEASPPHASNAGALAANKLKNRSIDLLPFDHSRVRLSTTEVDEDYINANYIPGNISKREYIATQGPLPGTLDHFWRMVWEQNVTMIVMLTQLVEKGKITCEQYWPEILEERIAYGDLVVMKREESVLPEYTIRTFDIQKGGTTRSVKQILASFWPHSGRPAQTDSLLNLVRVVRSHMKPESKGPLLVHCSEGVGRTGTYIAVDRLLMHMQNHDQLDIYDLVLEMRGYRCRMVETKDQYVYISDCLKEALLRNGQSQAASQTYEVMVLSSDHCYETLNAYEIPSEGPVIEDATRCYEIPVVSRIYENIDGKSFAVQPPDRQIYENTGLYLEDE